MTDKNNPDFNEEFEDKDIEENQNSKTTYERFTEEEYEQFAKLFNGISLERAKEILSVIKFKQETDIVKTIILNDSSIAEATANLNLLFITVSNKSANVKAKIRSALKEGETLTLKSGITIKNNGKPLNWEHLHDFPNFSTTQVSDNTKNYFSFTEEDYEQFFEIYKEIEQEALKDALELLNHREKIILWLIDILNYSAKEIAELYKIKHAPMATSINGARNPINRLGEQATVNNAKSNVPSPEQTSNVNSMTHAEYVKLLLYKQVLSREDYFVLYTLSVLKKPKYMLEHICDIETYQIKQIISEASKIYNMPTQAYISQTMIAREHYETYKQIKEENQDKPIDLALLAPDYNPDIERILDIRFLESLLLSNKDTLKGERIFYAFYNNRYGKKKLTIEELAKKLNTSSEAIQSSFNNIQKRLDDYHASTHYQKTKERLLSLPFEKRYEIFTNLVQPSYNPEVANYYLLKTLKDRLGKEKQIDFNILYMSKYSTVPKTLEEIAELFPTLTFEEITQKYNETNELVKKISNGKELRELHDKNAKEKVDFAVFRPIINPEHLELASNAETINHTIFNSLVRELNIEDYWIAWSITFSKGSFKGATTNKDFTEFLANELNIEITEAESISKRITTLIVTKTINQASRKVKMFKKDFMIPRPVFAPAFKKVVLDNYFRSTFDNTINTVAHYTYIEKTKSNQEIAQLIGTTVEEVNTMQAEIKAKVNGFINSSNYTNIFEQLSQLSRSDKIAIVDGTVQLEDILVITPYQHSEIITIIEDNTPVQQENLTTTGNNNVALKKIKKTPVPRKDIINVFDRYPDVTPAKLIAIINSNPHELQRKVLEMHEGLNGQEKMKKAAIATELGISTAKVRSSLFGGYTKINSVLKGTSRKKTTIFEKYPSVAPEKIKEVVSSNKNKLQRKIIEMSEGLNGYERTDNSDIAVALNITPQQVKSILGNGLTKIKKDLQKEEPMQSIFTWNDIYAYTNFSFNENGEPIFSFTEEDYKTFFAKYKDVPEDILLSGLDSLDDTKKIMIWLNEIKGHKPGIIAPLFNQTGYQTNANIRQIKAKIVKPIKPQKKKQKKKQTIYEKHPSKQEEDIVAATKCIKNDTQRMILEMREGLNGYERTSVEEIAKQLGIDIRKVRNSLGYSYKLISDKLNLPPKQRKERENHSHDKHKKTPPKVLTWNEIHAHSNFNFDTTNDNPPIFSFTTEDYATLFDKYKTISPIKLQTALEALPEEKKIMFWLVEVKKYRPRQVAPLFNKTREQTTWIISKTRNKIITYKEKDTTTKRRTPTILKKYPDKTIEEISAAAKNITEDLHRRVLEMFEGLNGHKPTDTTSIANHLGITKEKVKITLPTSRKMLDRILNPKATAKQLKSHSAINIYKRNPNNTPEEISEAVKKVKIDKQRQAIEMREGLHGYQETTVHDIAVALEVPLKQARNFLNSGYVSVKKILNQPKLETKPLTWENIHKYPNFNVSDVDGTVLKFSFTEEDYAVLSSNYQDVPKDRLCSELESLSEQQQIVFWLQKVKDYSSKEIGALFNQTSQQSHSLIHYIKKRLERNLAGTNKNHWPNAYELYPESTPEEIMKAVKSIEDDQERQIYKMHKGLDGKQKTTRPAIAKQLGIEVKQVTNSLLKSDRYLTKILNPPIENLRIFTLVEQQMILQTTSGLNGNVKKIAKQFGCTQQEIKVERDRLIQTAIDSLREEKTDSENVPQITSLTVHKEPVDTKISTTLVQASINGLTPTLTMKVDIPRHTTKHLGSMPHIKPLK